ncbi:DUF1801 domain-containing protein [Paracoccus liaowanqingii]|uniref:DUF1801 domain-containing protein n=1 Tax=Paracoccus liaowanqingii TaxID=2560053 RepID=A0A4V1BIQ3_9RHOB|nr:DUF1801 domain-containing protein [Paracoccus liaowanqingii]QBX33592.1 DUF1801 domain-containing protein [Paracoccus liaowanqingii]
MSDADRPRLLSSGNPQIPKGEGPAPVRAYIEAMPGWKREVGDCLDRMAVRACPDLRMAVRWNTPFYGKKDGWFFCMYCYTAHVQLSFFRGADLVPPPPKQSKVAGVRYVDIREGPWDQAQVEDWLVQAAQRPGVQL